VRARLRPPSRGLMVAPPIVPRKPSLVPLPFGTNAAAGTVTLKKGGPPFVSETVTAWSGSPSCASVAEVRPSRASLSRPPPGRVRRTRRRSKALTLAIGPRFPTSSTARWPADGTDGKPARVFPVSPEKQHALAARMRALGVREEDVEERFVRSGVPARRRGAPAPPPAPRRERRGLRRSAALWGEEAAEERGELGGGQLARRCGRVADVAVRQEGARGGEHDARERARGARGER